MRSRAALAVLLLATLAGCGSNTPAASSPTEQASAQTTPATTTSPTPSPSPSPIPVAKDEYDGAQRLLGGLTKVGIDCINWERTPDPIGADERGSCYVGEEELVVSIYATREDAAAEPESKAVILEGVADVHMVVGGNWTLSCDTQAMCQTIEESFGGKLVVIPA